MLLRSPLARPLTPTEVAPHENDVASRTRAAHVVCGVGQVARSYASRGLGGVKRSTW
jgi:hypothetical protein